jgi:hypothetical protein
MNIAYKNLDAEQRVVAVQRLTALWAFTESGLGGVMHALQIPFTGLLVGGMAVIMISMITEISEHNYKQILKSALIVLIVKAMVSPHTPFPAYIAVSFQALLGYCLFSLMKVNLISILLLSIIAMLESAIQKLLILTLFFGESFWKAADGLIALLAKQFGFTAVNGSYWVIAVYLFIYMAGGIVIALLALRTIKSFYSDKAIAVTDLISAADEGSEIKKSAGKNKFKKLWLLIGLMISLSVILFFFASNSKQGWLAVVKTISWTFSAILVWYIIIGPLFTKAIQKFLKKKQSRYSEDVLQTLSFIPVLRRLTTLAWQQSKLGKGFRRWTVFVSILIHLTLTYSEPVTIK